MQNYNIFATQPSFYYADFYLFSLASLYTTDWDSESIILNNSAPKKPFTTNPSTRLAHNAIIPALITNKKRPSEKTVIGKVKNTNIGFTKTFNKPNTIETIIADFTPAT